MARSIPIAVVIPTQVGRSLEYLLERIEACDPQPAEIFVHVDGLEDISSEAAPRLSGEVKVLASATRLGPGGARHRCLLACLSPYAVSFDDDSYPVDDDFFGRVWELFSEHSRAAILGATIWHRHE